MVYQLSVEQYRSLWRGVIWDDFSSEPGGVLFNDYLRVRFKVSVHFGTRMVMGTEEAVAWFLMHL